MFKRVRKLLSMFIHIGILKTLVLIIANENFFAILLYHSINYRLEFHL